MASKRKKKTQVQKTVEDLYSRKDEREYVAQATNEPFKENYFDNPTFNVAKSKTLLRDEIYLRKAVPAEGSLTCPNCGSTNILEGGKQTRSLDEAGTPSATCRKCGKIFRPN